MSVRERTRQQLDPAGTTGVRLFTVVVMLGAIAYAVVETALSWSETVDPVVAGLALACVAAAVVLVVVGSSPYRAPLTRGTHLFAEGFVILSVFLDTASMWGSDSFVRDDWGPIVLGALFLAMGPYRPAMEIAVAGGVSVVFVGFLVMLEVPWFVTDAPTSAFVLVAIAPMVALCAGSVAYSLGVVSAIERWQRRATEASSDLARELRDGIARSVQQDRVTILGRDVLPFFAGVLADGEITDVDRARARSIARSIRDVMVAEADRSWLEGFVASGGPGSPDATALVEDDARLARWMTTDQRTAVRALLVALMQTADFRRDDLHIRLTPDGEACRVDIAARFDDSDIAPRQLFAPFFALVRSTFDAVEVEVEYPSLRLRFWYEQH
jgi:hypothetical protein